MIITVQQVDYYRFIACFSKLGRFFKSFTLEVKITKLVVKLNVIRIALDHRLHVSQRRVRPILRQSVILP